MILKIVIMLIFLLSCGNNDQLINTGKCENIGIHGTWSDLLPRGRRIRISENCNMLDSKCGRSYKPLIVTANRITMRYVIGSSDLLCDGGDDIDCKYYYYGDRIRLECGNEQLELWRD